MFDYPTVTLGARLASQSRPSAPHDSALGGQFPCPALGTIGNTATDNTPGYIIYVIFTYDNCGYSTAPTNTVLTLDLRKQKN